jgi:hypothetical protein
MTFKPIFALWPITPFGADDESEPQRDIEADNSGQSGGNANNQAAQGNSSNNSENSQNSDEDDPYAGLTARELKRLLKDAEANNTTVAQELKQLQEEKRQAEEAKLSAEEKKDRRISELESQVNSLRTTLVKQAIINAINENKTYEWNSAAIVAQQLDSSKIKVDDNGKVTGLEKELARIANDPNLNFLLRQKNTDENNQQSNNAQQQQGPTGFQPGQGGARNGNGIPNNAQELAKLIPALNSRL